MSKKPLSAAQQSHDLVAQVGQCGFEKLQNIVGAGYVARPQPEIGDQPRFRHEGQERVVTCSTLLGRVVAPSCTFLFSVAGHDRGIKIKRQLGQRREIAEDPAISFGLHPFVGEHVKARKPPLDGLELRRAFPSEQPGQRVIQAHNLGMSKAAGSAPDRDDELFDQLQRRVSPI